VRIPTSSYQAGHRNAFSFTTDSSGRGQGSGEWPVNLEKVASSEWHENSSQCDGPTRKLGANEPKIRLQLVGCQRLTSYGFGRSPTIKPNPGTKPGFQPLEERPATFWKKHKESRIRKLGRKETALIGGSWELCGSRG